MNTSLELYVNQEEAATRLDTFLTGHISDQSRTFIQKLITEGHVAVNNVVRTKSGLALKLGDSVQVTIPEIKPLKPSEKQVDHLAVEIIFDHPDFFIINKPAGLIVHAPSKTSQITTLVDWLVTYCSSLETVGQPDRPGIVHRLDKDTSGLMIIPRTNQAHAAFTALFKERKIHKTYLALVQGHPPREAILDFRIGRHPTDGKMSHIAPHGRDALTHITTLQYFTHKSNHYALLEARPVTGRTHQIRVHCLGMGHPLLGDILYGSKSFLIERHALHAHALSFTWQGKEYRFKAPLPADMAQALEQLKS